jgi:hypothetical protein
MIQAAIERFVDIRGLEDVRFGFDRWQISLEELRTLEATVRWLQRLAPRQILFS